MLCGVTYKGIMFVCCRFKFPLSVVKLAFGTLNTFEFDCAIKGLVMTLTIDL